MAPHLFKYRSGHGIPSGLHVNDDLIPDWGHRHNEKAYRVIEDSEVVEAILEYDEQREVGPRLFDHLAPEEIEDILESAKEAVTAIEAGEHDDILDMVLVAERRIKSGRVTVIEAVEARNRVVVEQRSQTDDDKALQPNDIVTAG